MNNEELKKKIVDIIQMKLQECPFQPLGITYGEAAEYVADALIAAGIGDVTEWKEKAEKHRVQVLPDGTIKQLYSDEEVEDIARQRDEYKHRAAMAERAVENLSYKRAKILLYDDSKTAMEKIKQAELRQAEKELAEERKDD